MPTLSCSGARAQTESLFFGLAAVGFAVFGRGMPDLFFEYAVEVAHTAEAAAVSDAGHRRAFYAVFSPRSPYAFVSNYCEQGIFATQTGEKVALCPAYGTGGVLKYKMRTIRRDKSVFGGRNDCRSDRAKAYKGVFFGGRRSKKYRQFSQKRLPLLTAPRLKRECGANYRKNRRVRFFLCEILPKSKKCRFFLDSGWD